MKIINLNQIQYRNYSNIHSKRNFGQTVEYSNLRFNTDKKRKFLGLIDDNNNIQAAALILIHSVSPGIYEAIAPNGFLIDYNNFTLVQTFTELLKKYLLKERVTYLITNPMYKSKVYLKDNHILENNDNILYNLNQFGYKSIGYFSEFEKYDVIIENNDSLDDIYNNFNRNTKRNIKEAMNLEITLHKGTISDLESSYEIFKKKTNKKLAYYQNLMSIYNNTDNKMEIFFAKMNPHKYLVNTQKAYEKAKEENEKIHRIFEYNLGNMNDKILNRKINSDNTLEKIRNELNNAIKINQEYTDDIIIGTSIIIRNNHEIYFLIDGYKEYFRKIHTTHILKWAIISKYFKMGYRIFNLGEIHQNYRDKLNKYHGQYMYKIGFGGNVVEYPPNLLLVVNKPLYAMYNKIIKKI